MRPVVSASAIGPCKAFELPTLVRSVHSNSIRLFAGVGVPLFRELIGRDSNSAFTGLPRPIVFLEMPRSQSTETIVSAAIDQIAKAAFDLWPLWFGGEDKLSELKDDAISRMYLPIKLATMASHRLPSLSTSWAEAAIEQTRQGRPPRIKGAALETEWSQLCHAISPNGIIVVVTLEEITPQSTWPLVHALEWIAAKGDVAVAVLSRNIPPHEPPFDHLLFHSRFVEALPAGSSILEEVPQHVPDRHPASVEIILPPVFGRPHPQSVIEQRLFNLIANDEELAPKFAFNMRVEDVSLKSPTVDLLWPKGRLVVEFDGSEHRGQRAYRDDRHRDFELLCAGYLVLRIPNDEIVEDFKKTLEKIRSFTRLRSSFNGETK